MDDNEFSARDIQELLPFYVNKTLPAEQRLAVEKYLAAHPGANDDVTFLMAAARSMAAEIQEMDPLAGYAGFKKRLDALHPPRAPQSSFSHWWTRSRERMAQWGLSPAMAVLLVLIGTQLVMTLQSQFGDDPAISAGTMRGLRGGVSGGLPATPAAPAAPAASAQLKIIMKAGVQFDAVVNLLLINRCTIVWGPSAQGELWLTIDPMSTANDIGERLRASGLIENVQQLQQKAP